MIRRLLLIALLAQGCTTAADRRYYAQRAANRVAQIQLWGQELEDRQITKDEYDELVETLDDRQQVEDLGR